MAVTRKQPLRTCIACRTGADKRTFVRIVRIQNSESDSAVPGQAQVCVDPTGRRAGRGAYICGCAECFERARKIKALERALRCTIPDSEYERLASEFFDLCATRQHTTGMVENA